MLSKQNIAIMSLVLLVMFVLGCTSQNTYFENKYVKFKVPNGVVVEDLSGDNNLFISLKKGDTTIGTIGLLYVSPGDSNNGNPITVSSKNATEWSGTGDMLHVYTGQDKGISLNFGSGYHDDYLTVKDSLIIKDTVSNISF